LAEEENQNWPDIQNSIEEKKESIYQKKTPKTSSPYFPVKDHLENRYFPPGVLGFANPSTGEAFVNQNVYGSMKEVVKLHERLHLMYPHINETGIRVLTNELSGGPYIPTGRAY
jgi:hypothetical protein